MKAIYFLVILIVVSVTGCISPSTEPYRIIICSNPDCPICAGYFDSKTNTADEIKEAESFYH
jgi:hypothetical protein